MYWKSTKGEKDITRLVQTLELKLQSTDRYADLKLNNFNLIYRVE